MPSRLPQIFLNNSAVFESPITRKKQGGIFELNLRDKQFEELNSTFTAGFKDKHFKTSINNKIIKDTQSYFRTLPLRVNQYDVPKEKRLLTSHFSLFRSAKVKSFSLEKNPESCQVFHSCEEEGNVNAIIGNRKMELSDLEMKMSPMRFVGEEYRRELGKVRERFEGELNELESGVRELVSNLRSQINILRKETGNELKKNRMEMEKYEGELRMYREMAEDFPAKLEKIERQI